MKFILPFLSFLTCLTALSIDRRQNDDRSIQALSRDLTQEIMVMTSIDIEPSLDWATIQIESMVPVALENTTTPVVSPRPQIRKVMGELGSAVMRELKPGLESAVIHLLKSHAENPETADKIISKEELSTFVTDISHIWASVISNAVQKWSQNNLEKLMGFLGNMLMGVGKEILKRLGQLGGFLLHQHRSYAF